MLCDVTQNTGTPDPPAPNKALGRPIPAAEVSHLLQDLTTLLQPLTGYAEMVASGALRPDKLPAALRAIRESSTALLERIHDARAGLLAARGGAPAGGYPNTPTIESTDEHT